MVTVGHRSTSTRLAVPPLQIQVEFSAPTNGNASVVVAGDSIYTLYNSSDPNSDTVTRFSVEPLQFHFHGAREGMGPWLQLRQRMHGGRADNQPHEAGLGRSSWATWLRGSMCSRQRQWRVGGRLPGCHRALPAVVACSHL